MINKVDGNDDELFILTDTDDPVFCSRMSPMTSEELEILAEMKDLKEQARAIREKLAGILPDWKQFLNSPHPHAIPDRAKPYLQRLDELRIKWKDRDASYQEARHRRMVALGHEDL